MGNKINLFNQEDWILFKKAIQYRFSEEINQVEYHKDYYKLMIDGQYSYWNHNEIENIIKQYLRDKNLSDILKN